MFMSSQNRAWKGSYLTLTSFSILRFSEWQLIYIRFLSKSMAIIFYSAWIKETVMKFELLPEHFFGSIIYECDPLLTLSKVNRKLKRRFCTGRILLAVHGNPILLQ